MTAEFDVPESGGDGVIVTQGGHAGGYALYLQDRRIHWTYNFLGTQITTVSSEEQLEPGPCTIGLTFTPTGRFQGDLSIMRDEVPIAKGHIAQTTPVTYGIIGFTVGYQRGTPVSPTYKAPFALADGVLKRVVIEPDGREYRVRQPRSAPRSRCNRCVTTRVEVPTAVVDSTDERRVRLRGSAVVGRSSQRTGPSTTPSESERVACARLGTRSRSSSGGSTPAGM